MENINVGDTPIDDIRIGTDSFECVYIGTELIVCKVEEIAKEYNNDILNKYKRIKDD